VLYLFYFDSETINDVGGLCPKATTKKGQPFSGKKVQPVLLEDFLTSK